MKTFIVGTFFILGWTFYVLSGGADFVPEERVVAEAEPNVVEEVEVASVAPETVEVTETATDAVSEPVEVTRADTTILLDLSTAELTQPATEVIEEVAVTSADTPAVEAVLASIFEEAPVLEAAPEPDLDIRVVAGSRVNMRSGPGTNYVVLDTLNGGTEAEVLEVDASGWARIRLMDSGTIGWMAERLLSES